MKLPLFIARRYLFSKKSKKAINIISWISVSSIAIASFALITVLSAFNGLQNLVEGMYEGFEPNVNVSPMKGKWLEISEEDIEYIRRIEGVKYCGKVLESLTLVKYGEQQTPCTVKGVEEDFLEAVDLDSSIIRGSAALWENGIPTAVVGYGLSYKLGVYINDVMNSLTLYTPQLKGNIHLNPDRAFRKKSISPSGIYLINPDIDNKFLIVPISFAQSLMNKEGAFTDIEIKTTKGSEDLVQELIAKRLGDEYKVETRFDLNPLIYKTNQTEKAVTFFILAFILIISTFNVVSTLTMIVLEKKSDLKTFSILGLSKANLRQVFVSEGLMINGLGAGIGLITGIILVILQQEYGLLRLEGGIVDYYPVKLMFSDLLIIASTVFGIGYLAAYFPSRILIK